MKIRGGAEGENSDSEPSKADEKSIEGNDSTEQSVSESVAGVKKHSTVMQQKMSGQLDKLDALLTKTENAQYSMESQNKQIKSLLKK